MLKPITRKGISSNMNNKKDRGEVTSSNSSRKHAESESPAQHKTQ